MSKAIAQLINQPEQLVSSVLQKMEDLNGNPSEDARLLAESIQKLRRKTQDLQLDPNDTTSEELYQALRAKFANDCAQVNQAAGINKDSSLATRAGKATELIAASGQLPQMWLIKHAALKKALRDNPPRKAIKALNYRSLESFIKHEDTDAAYLIAGQLETKLWHSKMAKVLGSLGSAEYEMRQVRPLILRQKYWQHTATISRHILSDRHAGVVALWPAGLSATAEVLPLAIGLIDKIEKLSGQSMSDKIGGLNPQLRWWSENSYLISRHENSQVSLNIKDLASDHLLVRDYPKHSTKYAAQSLLDELVQRYQNQSDKVSEALKDIGYNLGGDLSNGTQAPLGERLAAEYALAE